MPEYKQVEDEDESEAKEKKEVAFADKVLHSFVSEKIEVNQNGYQKTQERTSLRPCHTKLRPHGVFAAL
uniref:Uncharacterized protein n=1 Tax=Magallana gigas TaxID=29159 RepID=K1R670_MAGGI